MPVVIQSSTTTTTTAGAVLNATSQDVRGVLANSGGDSTILLDYVNRITNELLRFSRWKFILSAPQVFLTTPGITDYYIGAAASTPTGSVNTGLGLADVFVIVPGEFIDRTQFRRIGKTDSPPIGQVFTVPGKPKLWRNSPDTPYTINIYPPPVQNTAQFVPAAAITTAASGGALANRTYYITLTFKDNMGGESVASIEQIVRVPAGQLLTVQSPVLPLTTDATTLLTPTGPTINSYNIYASNVSSGGERLQVANTALGTPWTEPGTGLTSSGAAAPSTNTLAVLGGYVLEFKYYQVRQTINNIAQIIQIPDTYFDIVVAGVNWLAFKYLEMDENAQLWKQVFEAGKVQMVKDANLNPRGEEYIRPDTASITQNSTTGVGLDSGIESSLP